MVTVRDGTELSGSGVPARIKFAVDYDADSETGSYGYPCDVFIVFRDSEIFLSQGKAVCVVVYVDRYVELLLEDVFQVYLVPGRDVGRVDDYTVLDIYQARYADSYSGD